MDSPRAVTVSKFLSRHLRHAPAAIGLRLDEAGWVEVDVLLEAAGAHGVALTRAELEHVVATSDKQRFAVDGSRIRANQGHSVEVSLGLPEAEPPEVLFHGTVPVALDSIRAQGLLPMRRHDVHLSPDVETAARVGARRGRPVVLAVDAAGMRRAGHVFRVSANGVWLVQSVPVEYLRLWSGP